MTTLQRAGPVQGVAATIVPSVEGSALAFLRHIMVETFGTETINQDAESMLIPEKGDGPPLITGPEDQQANSFFYFDTVAEDMYLRISFNPKRYVRIGSGTSTPRPVMDSIYFGLSADAVPEPDEATIAAVRGSAEIAAFSDMHMLIFRLASEDDITSVVFSDDQSQTNQIGVFTKYGSTVVPTPETQPFNVWVSDELLTQPQAATATVG